MRRVMVDVVIGAAVLVFAWWNAELFLAEYHYQKGLKEKEAGRQEQALTQFEKAVEILPERAQYQRTLGQTSHDAYKPGSGNLRPLYRAYDAYREVLIDDPEYPYGWFEIARVLEDFRDAKVSGLPSPDSFFKHAVEIDPANPRFLAGLLEWEIKQGRPAQQCWSLFMELVKSYPQAISLFGDVMLKNEGDLERLGKEVATDREANLFLANYLLKAGKPERAYEQLDLIKGPEAQERDVWELRARILISLGRTEEAGRVLAEALKQTPADPTLSLLLFNVLKDQGDWKGAIAVNQEVLKSHPDRLAAAMNAAQLARRQGQDDLAVELYQKALDSGKAPAWARKEIYKFRGEVKYKRGDLGGALADYEKCLQLAPNDQDISLAMKKIKLEMEYEKYRSGDR